MAQPQRFQLFLMLLAIIIVAVSQQCSSARPLSIQNHQLGKQMHWSIFLLLDALKNDNNNVMILIPWFFLFILFRKFKDVCYSWSCMQVLRWWNRWMQKYMGWFLLKASVSSMEISLMICDWYTNFYLITIHMIL